jgi:hypothetical protein
MGFRYRETRQNLEIVHRQMADARRAGGSQLSRRPGRSAWPAQPRKLTDGRLGDDYIAELHHS